MTNTSTKKSRILPLTNEQKRLFAHQLSLFMFHRSLNYSDMAKLCGISLTTVSRLYNHKKCTPATIKKILRGLQISMDDFLEFSLPGDHFAKLSMRSSSEEA